MSRKPTKRDLHTYADTIVKDCGRLADALNPYAEGTLHNIGDTVAVGGTVATVVEIRTATDGSWTDYRLATAAGGLLWMPSQSVARPN